MEIQKGSIVYSKAGRDKAKKLLVLRMENDYAYVADGSLRTADKPKKKKLKHLQKTNCTADIKSDITDSEIRRILREYEADN